VGVDGAVTVTVMVGVVAVVYALRPASNFFALTR
jgi:hypothetical protein